MRRFYRFVLLAFVLVAIGSVATHELASAAAVTPAPGVGVPNLTAPYTMKMALVSDVSTCATASVSANASGSIPNDNGVTVKVLCAELTDSTGAAVPLVPITFAVSLGLVSTGTAKTVTAITGSNGRATTQYRTTSGVLAGTTDTAIASISSSFNAVATISIQYIGGATPTPTPVVTPAPAPTTPPNTEGAIARVGFAASTDACSSAALATSSTASIATGASGAICVQTVTSSGSVLPTNVVLITVSSGTLTTNGFSLKSTTPITDANGRVSVPYTAPSTPGLDNVLVQNVTTNGTNGLITLTVGGGTTATPVPTASATPAPTATAVPTATSTSTPGVVPPGFDMTSSGTPFSSTTNPGGYGKEIGVIRDGQYPNAPGTTQAVVFDTFHPGPPDLEQWIGYQFVGTQLFRGVLYQEGNHYPDGGWWNSLRVQVRVNGVWTDAANTLVQPSYPFGAGAGFATYSLSFSPLSGDGIRLFGTPGGTAAFVSVAELRAYGDQGVSTTPPTQTSGAGTITAGTPPPSNGGFAVFVFGGGSNGQLASAAGCAPGQGVFWVTNAGGEFITYVVGTQISAVNALWNSMFANGITANQPMIGTCR